MNAFRDSSCSIQDLTHSTSKYFRDITGLLVSITVGTPSWIFITDLTANDDIVSDYPTNVNIGFTKEQFPSNKIFQIIVYPQRLAPLLQELETKRNCNPAFDGNNINLTELGIFVKCKVAVKTYNHAIEGAAQVITLMDHTTFSTREPVFKNVIQGLPPHFVKQFRKNFALTVPELYLTQWLNNSSSNSNSTSSTNTTNIATRQVLSTPHDFATPSTPTLQSINHHSLPSLPSDARHRSDFVPSTTKTVSPFMDQLSASVSQGQVQVQPQQESRPRKKQRVLASHIRRLNSIEQVDGKVFNVIGTIVEIEPLLNQFCIKSDINSPPQLIPITIIMRGNLTTNADELDESYFLRISIVERSQILRFLGMSEIEEVYIRSSEISSKFIKVLKSKRQIEVSVMRRLLRINDVGSAMLGWESNDITLEKILLE
jgi:hypothetical protein